MAICKEDFEKILDFVYQNYECNDILPALLMAYRYLKDILPIKSVFIIRAEVFIVARDGKKECSKCHKTKPATKEYFPERAKSPDGWDSWCKKCKKKYDKLYHIWKKYGITPEQYFAMLKRQHYRCGSCGVPINEDTAEVHHKHGTTIVYGLLCDRCNRTISLAKDDWRLLLKATIYQAAKEETDIREYLKCNDS